MNPCCSFQIVRAWCGALAVVGWCLVMFSGHMAVAMPPTIMRGQPLPDAELVGVNNVAVALHDVTGRVKLLSIVPQLNTPVCDEQTHRFSDMRTAADRGLTIVTISTNTHDDQARFAENAGIANLTFLSDAPHFDFGTRTGLLHPAHRMLQRAVVVVDADNVVRYLEIVPMGQLPNIEAAMAAARTLLVVTPAAHRPRRTGPRRDIPRWHDTADGHRLPPLATTAVAHRARAVPSSSRDARESVAPGDRHRGFATPASAPGIIGVALHLTAERVGDPAGLVIRATHPMGPAAQAGLAHGQEILAVDGQSITGKTYREVVTMIRGEVGTPVTLLVKTMAAVTDVRVVRTSEAILDE